MGEWTDQPTENGDYWFSYDGTSEPSCCQVYDGRVAIPGDEDRVLISSMTGKWMLIRKPLPPVTQ